MVVEGAELARLGRKFGVECLWPFVLALLEKRKRHAYALQEELDRAFGIKAGRIISYRVLYGLESGGFVRSEEKKVNGRIRRYYSITKKGRELLKAARTFIKARMP